ncbi:unnamed protein product, partial [Rotaria magnacalcarata]
MVIPDPEAKITAQNVLSVFESIRGQNGKDAYNAVIIPPGKTKYLNIPVTGMMYTDYESGGETVTHDPRLYFPGQIVVAPMTEILSATAANAGGSNVTRTWVGEVAVVKCELSCHFYDKCYIPKNLIPTAAVGNPGQSHNERSEEPIQSLLPIQGEAVPYPVTTFAGNPAGGSAALLVTGTPAPVQGATVNTSLLNLDVATQESGPAGKALIGGSKQRIRGAFARNTRPVLNAGIEEISWSGIFDYVQSNVGPLIKGGLEMLFGSFAGGCIYDIGKAIYTTLTDISQLPPSPAGGPIAGSSL